MQTAHNFPFWLLQIFRAKTICSRYRKQCIKHRNQKIFDDHRSRYGSLRITKVLEQKEIKVNRKRVAKLIRIMNLSPKGTNHKYKRYHQNNSKEELANLLNQIFKALKRTRYG